MRDEACTDEAVLNEPVKVARSGLQLGKAMTRYWGEVLVIALALLLWAPRFSGPIDLRWDGGVYYLLGTSLAEGHGYRIPSEPGSPEAIQYPPLLPAIVGASELALGTTDPAVVAPWLRKLYVALFMAYAVAVLVLARRHLRPGFAVIAAALCLFQVMTIFLSDLLFAELPFALISVVFALVAVNGSPASRPWLREAGSFALAAAGFLLRTAGLALLGAWVLDALIRRRWWLVVTRSALALLPILAWQAHVARVRASDEYIHPAYEYQRAPYQYYNVSYTENILLIDPFRPELGPVNARTLAVRAMANVPSMLVGVGQTVSTRIGYWLQLLDRPQERVLGRMIIPENVVFVPVLILAALVLVGLILLARRGAWLMVFIVLGSLGLTCTTPWPAQFVRYLSGLAPFLIICAFLALSKIRAVLPNTKSGVGSTLARTTVTGLILLTFLAQVYGAGKLFQQRLSEGGRMLAPAPNGGTSRAFYHDRRWQAWEATAAWVKTHASSDAIVATSVPHFFYLRTGLRAVLPPMDADPERARHLLDGVPVSYLIVDELDFLDISRRYGRPAVESDPAGWRLVHQIEDTKTYARINNAE